MALHIENRELEESLAERARVEGLSLHAYAERVLSREVEARPEAGLKQPTRSSHFLVPDAAAPFVENRGNRRAETLTLEEAERLSDELDEEIAAALPPDYRPLSEEALRRENLYEDDGR